MKGLISEGAYEQRKTAAYKLWSYISLQGVSGGLINGAAYIRGGL